MNTINAMSLADIELDLPIRPVTDDLAGFSNQLSPKVGLERGYASFAARTFSLGEISSRAIGYADEVTRFVALAGTSEPQQVAYLFDVLIALSLLNAAATVTVALAPPRSQGDFAARRRGSRRHHRGCWRRPGVRRARPQSLRRPWHGRHRPCGAELQRCDGARPRQGPGGSAGDARA